MYDCICNMAGTNACNSFFKYKFMMKQHQIGKSLTPVLGTTNAKQKPAIGPYPKHLWIEDRIKHLQEVINKVIEEKKTVKVVWINEYNNLLTQYDIAEKEFKASIAKG